MNERASRINKTLTKIIEYFQNYSKISEHMLEKSRDENIKSNKKGLEYISNYYSSLMINIGKKAQLRIDASIKRIVCKGCERLLIPTKTARVRIHKKPTRHVRWTCLHCGSYRTFNTTENYQIWSDNPEAQINVSEKQKTIEEKKED